MKLRTCLLALAGILGSAAIASAQPPPAPPPAPVDADAGAPADPNAPPAGTAAPVAPPPVVPTPAPVPADPNAPPPAGAQPTPAPAPAPVTEPAAPPTVAPAPAPVQPPAVQFGINGPDSGRDTTNPEGPGATAGPKPLVWRESTFTFNQAGTTTIFGVGADYQGPEGQFYGWDFKLVPNFYVYDAPKNKVSVFAEIGWETELTDSDTTTDKRETLFKDTQLGVRYARTIWESAGKEPGEYVTGGSVTGRVILPTSHSSATQGRYLVTALGLGARQQIKILGLKADGLNNVTVSPTITWSHLFARSYEPTSNDLGRERQNASGDSFNSDVLSYKSYAVNRLTLGMSLLLPLYKDLSLATQFRLVGSFKHDFQAGGSQNDGCDINVVQNQSCTVAERDPTHTLYQTTTTFDVALSYPIYEVVDLSLGYNNDTGQIGEDGTRRSIFYSPDAQFYLDITANLERIYSKATKRDKKPNASQWAKR